MNLPKSTLVISKEMRLAICLVLAFATYSELCYAEAYRRATAVAEVSNGKVVKIAITDGGKGYDFAPKITFKGGGGEGASAEVYEYLSGSVGRTVLQSGGSGYTSAPEVEIEPPDPARAIAMEKAEQERLETAAQKAAVEAAEKAKEDARKQLDEQEAAQRKKQSLITTARNVGLVVAIVGLVVAGYWARKSRVFGDFAKKDLGIIKYFAFAGIAIVILGGSVYALREIGKTKSNLNTIRGGSAEQVDPDPTGSWTSGDRNSVYSRLTVRASGTFSFETVDFTGDVKGGYSGTWRMDGKSVRFEWGSGGADSGSCSGRKSGRDTLVFGSTTFSR